MHVTSAWSYGSGYAPAVTEYLNWVEKFITPKKFETFKKLFRSPVDTIPLVEEAMAQLRRVFSGRDRHVRFDFTSPDLVDDWNEFLEGQFQWDTQGFETMATAINSVLAVDLPVEQNGDQPEPYIALYDITEVQDFRMSGVSDLDWLIVKVGNTNRMIVYDDESYRVIEWNGEGVVNIVVENPHDLGYCPARFFWTDPISHKEPAIKRSPLTNWLSKLDWFLLWATCKKHSDLYAPFPVHTVYKENCQYTTDDGQYCQGGYMFDASRNPVIFRSRPKPCPKCSVNELSGPGSLIKVERFNPETPLPESIKIEWPDAGTLEHILKQEEILKKEIFSGITGNSISLVQDQAINEKQVKSLFEDRLQVLLNIKRNFEMAQLFAQETQARLRYGERFIGAHISYGSEYYLFSTDEIYEIYTDSVKEKLPHTLLDDVYEQYIYTRYKENPTQVLRQRILSNLDPFSHLTDDQVTELFEKGLIDQVDFVVKKNFSSLIRRFERENMDLVEFGNMLDFKTKIDRIMEGLRSYVNVDNSDAGDISKALADYGIGVRAGAITPQTGDEDYFRGVLKLPEMSTEGLAAWTEDQGIRRPITLKSQTQIEGEI